MGKSLGRYDIMMLLYNDFKLDYCCYICGYICIGSEYGIFNLWKVFGYSNDYFLYVYVKMYFLGIWRGFINCCYGERWILKVF